MSGTCKLSKRYLLNTWKEGREGRRSRLPKLMILHRGYVTHRGGSQDALEAFSDDSYPYQKISDMCSLSPRDGEEPGHNDP